MTENIVFMERFIYLFWGQKLCYWDQLTAFHIQHIIHEREYKKKTQSYNCNIYIVSVIYMGWGRSHHNINFC